MSVPRPVLTPSAALAKLSVIGTDRCGVTVSDRDGIGLATVQARTGKHGLLAQRLRERFDIELPDGPRRASAGDIALAGTGPTAWLATCERGGNAFAGSLSQALGDLASICDQTDGHALLRLSGPRARDTLHKLVPIDVHPRAFRIGDVAVTAAAHVGATLWRIEDGANGSPTFEIAVFRSLAESFWFHLSHSAAEFGLRWIPSVTAVSR